LQLFGQRFVDLEGEHQRFRLHLLGDQPGKNARPRPQLDHGLGARETHVLEHQLREASGAGNDRSGAPRSSEERLQHAAMLTHGAHSIAFAAQALAGAAPC
jgi:hypothetical protein